MSRLIRWRLGAAAAVACSILAAPTTDAQSRLAPTLSLTASSSGHERCILPDPSPARVRAVHEQIRGHFGEADLARLRGGGLPQLLIPIAYHVVTSSSGAGDVSDAGIQAQHDVLNAAYEPWGIQFNMVAMTRTANDDWYGNVDLSGGQDNAAAFAMKSALSVDPSTTLNAFFTIMASSSTLGYAQFPNTWPETGPNAVRWSVVNRSGTEPGGSQAPYNEGDTATHEVGHALGLFHTFQGGCHADSVCESAGDGVCDTPAEASPYYGSCNTGRDTCPAQEGNDPVLNFMDYSDDDCMIEFTQGQAVRMNEMLSTFRPTFYANALATGVVVAEELEFGSTFVGFPVTETLNVLNVTDGDLTISSVSLPSGFSSDFSGPVTLENLESLQIEVTFDPNSAGDFSGTIEIETDFAKEPSYLVAVSGEAAFAPDITDPTAAEGSSFPDQLSTASFSFGNDGQGGLTWSIDGFAAARLIAAGQAMPATPDAGLLAEDLAKGEKSSLSGTPVRFDAGGPDDFGYTWIDSNESGGPSYDFVDISGSGTSVSLADDGAQSVDLPFDFPFYGGTFDDVDIVSNGFLNFGSSSTAYQNDPIPTSATPNAFIAPFWDDFDPSSGGSVYYEDMGDGRFIVQWDGVPFYQSSTSLTFQVILYLDGRVLFQYADVGDARGSDTIGIENLNGTDGLQVAFNTNYVEDDLAVLIAPPATWLSSVAPSSGALAPGETVTVEVLLDATDLEPDTYMDQLTIRSNDPDEPTKNVSVSLVVNDGNAPAAPMLTAPESGATFEPAPGETTAQVTVSWNAVEGAVSYDIEIATDAEFEDIVDSAAGFDATSGLTEPLGLDVYYWHVRANGENASSQWSPTRTFEVVRGTANEEDAPEQQDVQTALIGAFPNPFAQSATVRFAVAEAAEVALVVYDVLGKEVARLAEGEFPAGTHEATFRADGLAPGVYLVHFTADQQVHTRQVMIAR